MSDVTSYKALCSDFYINQRLALKLDLPSGRETVLGMFDRIRREFPSMRRFRRYSNELALEADSPDAVQQWLSLRRLSIRSGVVNPPTPHDAYRLHELVLETAPYFLSISPLDVDYLELLFGFDLIASGNHDAIVFDALIASDGAGGHSRSPLARMVEPGAPGVPLECQPVLGLGMTDSCDLQVHFEVKTRTPMRAVVSGEFEPAPISVYVTLRKYGSLEDVSELSAALSTLTRTGEELLRARVVPNLVVPLRDAIGSEQGEA